MGDHRRRALPHRLERHEGRWVRRRRTGLVAQTTLMAAALVMTVSGLAGPVLAEQGGPAPATSLQNAGGVAGSGMAQGSGAITTRADVALSVESLPGTSALRLGAIGEAIGTQMGAIRTCYADVTAERPSVTGAMRVRVQVPGNNRRPTLEVAEDTAGDAPLTACVLRALRAASLAGVRGPAGGMIVVQFQNSAAEGAAMVARERERTTETTVRMVDGAPQAESRTGGGEVVVVVRGTGQTTADAVAAYFLSIQARVGTLLDCRRRASRREQNPAGEIVSSLNVPARGNPTGQGVSSSVADVRAPQCVLRSLQEAGRGAPPGAAGAYRVTVRFAPQ